VRAPDALGSKESVVLEFFMVSEMIEQHLPKEAGFGQF
jgi:hypothetical protein